MNTKKKRKENGSIMKRPDKTVFNMRKKNQNLLTFISM